MKKLAWIFCILLGTFFVVPSGAKAAETAALCANGHTVAEDGAVAATTKKDGKTAGSHCSVCGEIIKASETIPRIDSGSVALSKAAYDYDGKEKRPEVTVKDRTGETIAQRYYAVTYQDNQEPGKAAAVIKFKGNYSGTIKKTFYINGWLKKNGKTVGYFLNGKKAKKQFVTARGKSYYVDQNGAMIKGWMKLGGNYYYFSRSNGVQAKSGTVDGVKITKEGTARKTAYNKEKIKVMIKAKSIVDKVTKSSDTKKKKRKKVFDWVLKHPYNRRRVLANARKKKGWEMTYANDIFEKGNGCCVSEACAFAFLAHECGYEKVYICDDTEHAWTEIGGRVYDTLFAESKSYQRYYGTSYKTAKLWLKNKKKV